LLTFSWYDLLNINLKLKICVNLGSSIDCARLIIEDMADIVLFLINIIYDKIIFINSIKKCINYMGGLHHAKKSKSAGFCFVNDIVLSI
jgi:hypothetical protein